MEGGVLFLLIVVGGVILPLVGFGRMADAVREAERKRTWNKFYAFGDWGSPDRRRWPNTTGD